MTFTRKGLKKTPTGIYGLDQVTGGGLPHGRPTLVCGGPGCGKTLFAMEFLVRGAVQYGEPGVFITFEEKEEDLVENVASLDFDLKQLIARKKIAVDYVRVEKNEIEESGEYDLDGLFVRLDYALKKIKAKRVVLDTIETLFGGLSNVGILRAEIRRLFFWLKDRGITTIITGERGEGQLTRHGLEEYVSDCVILLDHRVDEQMSTRRLRIVKYRGSSHGTNEYPFLIDDDGISVIPISASTLDHKVSNARVSSGVPELDQMLDGRGFYRGSSVLLSGTPGMGKTSLAAAFSLVQCRAGKRCLFFTFEESPDQILRNMKSVGIDLQPEVRRGRLKFHASRPSLYGLEMHLSVMHKLIQRFKPDAVILDPINNLISIGTELDVKAMLMRLFDHLKRNLITGFFTSLSSVDEALGHTEAEISSLMDTWIVLRDREAGAHRNREIFIMKSRGMAHSSQSHSFTMSRRGLHINPGPAPSAHGGPPR